MRDLIFLAILAVTVRLLAADIGKKEAKTVQDCACVAATGEKIPHPWSKKTHTVKDGAKRIEAPESMVYVPAGKFTMGEGESEHEVYLDGYCIGKYEVTNAEWKEFVVATAHRPLPRHWKEGRIPEGKENHPLLWVSWNDAQKYCEWVSKKTGRIVTLPTQAQWEKAARGPKGYIFPWGNDRKTENCNFNGLCASKYGLTMSSEGHVSGWKDFTETQKYREIVEAGGYTTPVGYFPQGKSFYGCYDMAGNAYEWCSDWYKNDYYKLKDADKNPQGPSEQEADTVKEPGYSGIARVIRGGSWYSHLISCSAVSYREVRDPKLQFHSVGFRIVALAP